MRSQQRLPLLDLLRMTAALAVLTFHFSFRGHAEGGFSHYWIPSIASVTKYGYFGVHLFFVISGFVILMSAGSATAKSFLVSRASRLYPAFWICCTLTAVLLALVRPSWWPPLTVSQYLVNMTLSSDLFGVRPVSGVYWSLFIEIQFYAVVTLMIATGRIRRPRKALLLWLVATLLTTLPGLETPHYLLGGDFSALFIGGACCYLIHRDGAGRATILLLFAAWLCACLYEVRRVPRLDSYFHTHYDARLIVLLITSFFAMGLGAAKAHAIRIDDRSLRTAGSITYPLYLIHEFPGYMLLSMMPGNAIRPFVVTALSMVVVAALIHLHGERPLYRWLSNRLGSHALNDSRYLTEVSAKRNPAAGPDQL